MSDAPVPGSRLRAAVLEVGLAVAGLLAGVSVFTVISALGLFPTEGAWGRGLQMAAGPAITLMAALGYRSVAQWIDHNDSPLIGPAPTRVAPFPRPSTLAAWAIVGLGIAAALAGSFVLGFVLDQLGMAVEEQESIVALVQGFVRGDAVLPFVVLVLSAVVCAPLAEEFLFRGLLFRRIASRGDSWPEAYALSAATFAAIHTNPAGFVIYGWLGLVFAESYRRSGRLWVAMLVHAANNAFALSLLVWG